MKIGFVSGDWVHPSRTHDGKEKWGGSGWVRVAQYMEYLPYDWVTGTLVWNKDCFVVRTTDEEYVFTPIIFMHRLMHNGLDEHVRQARANGQIIINDIDDWYWGLDPDNAAFIATHPKFNQTENRDNYRKILSLSDLVIVSTPYLASRLTDWCRAPMVVVKNTVDVSRFNTKVHEASIPTVGWVGSTAHRSRDLETMAGILPPMLNRGEILLHHSGAHPSHTPFAEKIGVRNDQVTTTPLSGHEDYPSLLHFDIGIVPLRHTPFNQAKSDIKGLEYASAGIPFVAQKIDAYEELYSSLGIGRLATNPASWIKHINKLKDPVLRAEESARQKEAVRARDITHGAVIMKEILDSFMG